MSAPPAPLDPRTLFSAGPHDANCHDMLLLIKDYLRKCGLQATASTLKNEAESLHKTGTKKQTYKREITHACLEGDWETLRDLANRAPPVRLRKAFLYAVNKQEFLELVNKQESHLAFNHLTRRLKPLEQQARVSGDDFRDLTYLITCRSVTDAASFKAWEGVAASRQKLAKALGASVARLFPSRNEELEEEEEQHRNEEQDGEHHHHQAAYLESESESDSDGEDPLDKPTRLVQLMQQAYAYQVEKQLKRSVAKPAAAPRISSLLVDFSATVLPDRNKCHALLGHTQSVKCVTFLGNRQLLASGSGDSNVVLWNLQEIDRSDQPPTSAYPSAAAAIPPGVNNNTVSSLERGKTVLKGHTARVWDLASSSDGSKLASVSADSTLRIWDVRDVDGNGTNTTEAGARRGDKEDFMTTHSTIPSHMINTGHAGDAYAVQFHPSSSFVVTTGFDKSVRLIDLETGTMVKSFRGHTGSVVHVTFNRMGNLIVTGSKDSTVKFFDVVSGVCVKTLPPMLGEVTSVALNKSGDKLLIGTKDSSNRLWDIRTGSSVARFKGHINASKNFIRTQFGSTDQIVLGGSEDGAVYVWDADSGNVLDKIYSHTGAVFRSTWSEECGWLASCGEDGMVKVWGF